MTLNIIFSNWEQKTALFTRTQTLVHKHTQTHAYEENQHNKWPERKWWWLTIMRSEVRNVQMELEPRHGGWSVVPVMYVPYRWHNALCQLCPGSCMWATLAVPSELFYCCLAVALLSGHSRGFGCISCDVLQHRIRQWSFFFFLGLFCQHIMQGLFFVFNHDGMIVLFAFLKASGLH